MEPFEFIEKWRASELKESSAAQEHFIDLCRLLGEPTPAEDDPIGDRYCFERGAKKDTGGGGWADVWKKHCFAWEYKGKDRDLDKAFEQLRQYSLALDNPPLLIVSDMETIRITTNWTNSVSKTETYVLDDLADAAKRQRLRWAMSEPERLRPDQTRQGLTEDVAETFASLAQALRDRGHDSHEVARFLNRLVFCMFAEDVDLLPKRIFTRMLRAARSSPSEFLPMVRELFANMAAGGRFGVETVAHFNGGLFSDDAALPLSKTEIETVLIAAELNWSDIDPSILGTLFERGLDPTKRSQLGAHYTDREKVMLIVEPVVVRPLEAEWRDVKKKIAVKLEQEQRQSTIRGVRRLRREAERLLREFLERLRQFTVLDPACGSGNFLYLALHALKDLEHRVQLEAEALGSFPRQFPGVGPANVKGIEVNPYAAELARVSIWIGEVQWMRRNGFSGARDPILDPLETIECRDAVLTPQNDRAEWPQADVVIGNPPFLGNRKMLRELGQEYADDLRETYKGLVRGKPDLVCYWVARAGQLSANGEIQRVGLVATNSIRSGTNRLVLDRIVKDSRIFDAWADEPWIVEGASVRVSLICFAPRKGTLPVALDGVEVPAIRPDLTAVGADLTRVANLGCNKGAAFQGDIKRGSFDIPGETARRWLEEPANPNGKPNADVLMPWINGSDLTRRPRDMWIVDFGTSMTEAEAALYELPFSHIERVVKPKRLKNREPRSRRFWFRHWNPRPKMWGALAGLSRYIATPRNAKHRLFVWRDVRICPDCQVVVIARDDDTTFGILHSRFHESWTLGRCSWLGQGNDPRYTPTTTFLTFPFPPGLSPNVPAIDYQADPRAQAIASAAQRLVELRDRWLNPPELVEWVDEPVAGYPKRPVPRNDRAAEALKTRALTKLYNDRPQWLAGAHAALDEAVADAYGWPADISEDDALARLLELNLAHAH